MANRLNDQMLRLLSLLGLGLVGVGAGVLWLLKQPCPAPDRPRGVPRVARWVGHCDGGSWVELLEGGAAGRFEVKVYHHPLGDLERQGWYRFTSGCEVKELTPGQVLERVKGLSPEGTLVLAGSLVGDRCRLEPEPLVKSSDE